MYWVDAGGHFVVEWDGADTFCVPDRELTWRRSSRNPEVMVGKQSDHLCRSATILGRWGCGRSVFEVSRSTYGLRLKAFQKQRRMVEIARNCWRCDCDQDPRVLCVRFVSGDFEVSWKDKPDKVFRAHYLGPVPASIAVQDVQQGLRRRSVAHKATAAGPRLRRRSVQAADHETQPPVSSPQEASGEIRAPGEILDPSEDEAADQVATPSFVRRKVRGTGRKPVRAVKKSCKRQVPARSPALARVAAGEVPAPGSK